MNTNGERHPLESLDASTQWIDALLGLFWATHASVMRGDPLPAEIEAAFAMAEVARRKL